MRAARLLFAMLALGSPALALASPPDWIRLPSAADFRKVYPVHAYQKNLEGSGTIQCVFNGQGKLDACRLLSEDPQGLGFGKASAALPNPRPCGSSESRRQASSLPCPLNTHWMVPDPSRFFW